MGRKEDAWTVFEGLGTTGSVDIFGTWKRLKKITIGHSAANLRRKRKSVRINIYVLFQELTKGSIE